MTDDSNHDKEQWSFRLYTVDRTPSSSRAIRNLEAICERHLKGRYRIEVVDLLKKPHLAAEHQILAVPTLVRCRPLPVHKMIGDLSSEQKVLVGLDMVREA